MTYDRRESGFVFRDDERGKFVCRPNRFIIEAETVEGVVPVHCANPGKLTEILLPGIELILETSNSVARKTRHTAAAAIHRGHVVPLVAERANRIAHSILAERYTESSNIRSEVTIGSSRFDFVVETINRTRIIEVKSCTLSEFGSAMFPDAATLRGRRHIRELAELSGTEFNGKTVESQVIFIITHGSPSRFVPHIHADPEFAIALREVSEAVEIEAISIDVNQDGGITGNPVNVPVVLDVADIAIANSGVYLAVIELKNRRSIKTGALGTIDFNSGWYVYVGSAKRNLRQRTGRHKARRKKFHWHVDYLIAEAESVKVYSIMTRIDLECSLSDSIRSISDQSIAKFGSSDCNCLSHLHYFATPPTECRRFVDTLLEYRHVFAF